MTTRAAALVAAAACAMSGIARGDDGATIVDATVAAPGLAPAAHADLDAVLVDRADAIAACEAAHRGRDLARTLVLVRVDRRGKARATAAGSGDAKVDRCIARALGRAAWPTTARGGAIVVAVAPRPTVATVEPAADASTAAADVMATFRGRRVSMNRCYAKALERDAAARPVTALEVTVDAAGAVTAVAAQPADADPTLVGCLRNVIRGVRVPAPGGELVVTLPLVQQ